MSLYNYYRTTKEEDVKSMTIQLQGIGRQPAVFAGDLKIGQILVWNHGGKSEVVEMNETPKMMIITEKYKDLSGEFKLNTRKMKKDRLVGYLPQ